MDSPRDANAKRKQTLLSLLDALTELSKDETMDGGGPRTSQIFFTVISLFAADNVQANFEDDHDVRAYSLLNLSYPL